MFTEYHELDMTGKLIWNFRNISHFLRKTSGGKGGQKRILTILLKSGRVTQTALTEYLGIRPGSASEVLSKMEAVGLIARQENETDRRTVNIELTENGRREALLATEERKRAHEELLSGLSREEQEELLLLLEKLTAHSREFGLDDYREGRKEQGDREHGMGAGKEQGDREHGIGAGKEQGDREHGTGARKEQGDREHGIGAGKEPGGREY